MPDLDSDANVKSLFAELKTGNTSAVEEMIMKDPGLMNATSEDGLSAVMTAIYYGRKDIVELLVSMGAQINIYEASASGDFKAFEKLMGGEPSLANSFSLDGFTPLHLASFFGSSEIAKYLIEKGADVNSIAKNPTKVMPLHSAAAGHHNDICELLVLHGADVNAKQQAGFTPLHEAAMNGNLEITKLLLDHGARINEKSDSGMTALGFTKMESRESGPKEDREKVGEYLRQHGTIE